MSPPQRLADGSPDHCPIREPGTKGHTAHKHGDTAEGRWASGHLPATWLRPAALLGGPSLQRGLCPDLQRASCCGPRGRPQGSPSRCSPLVRPSGPASRLPPGARSAVAQAAPALLLGGPLKPEGQHPQTDPKGPAVATPTQAGQGLRKSSAPSGMIHGPRVGSICPQRPRCSGQVSLGHGPGRSPEVR